MAEEKVILTYSGLKKYMEELENLEKNQRAEIAQKIKEAREQGDLSENAEYDAAKDEQRDIENRIKELKEMLNNAEVVDEDAADSSSVSIGTLVKLRDIEFDEVLEYRITSSNEASSLDGSISNESPLGKALLGHKKGQTVEVALPGGETAKFKIMNITIPKKEDNGNK